MLICYDLISFISLGWTSIEIWTRMMIDTNERTMGDCGERRELPKTIPILPKQFKHTHHFHLFQIISFQQNRLSFLFQTCEQHKVFHNNGIQSIWEGIETQNGKWEWKDWKTIETIINDCFLLFKTHQSPHPANISKWCHMHSDPYIVFDVILVYKPVKVFALLKTSFSSNSWKSRQNIWKCQFIRKEMTWECDVVDCVLNQRQFT